MELEKSNVDATIQPTDRDAIMPAYSLHLFAGAGGGMLADLIDGITPIAAVEIEPFPRRILAKRFPGIGIWDDVRTFRADNPECDRPWPFLPLGADPADLQTTMPGYVPRTTMRRRHRAPRVRALGNGQVPKCASAAFRMGLALLEGVAE